jgi:hypothetical protein
MPQPVVSPCPYCGSVLISKIDIADHFYRCDECRQVFRVDVSSTVPGQDELDEDDPQSNAQ